MKKLSICSFIFSFSIFLCANESWEKIAIIGAGPSGIVTAATLQDKGYTNITIFEKDDEIGGKVKTVFYDGVPYEMGAVVTEPHYDITFAIADELGVTLVPTPPSKDISPHGQVTDSLDWTKEQFGWSRFLTIGNGLRKFASWIWEHDDFFEPGFANTPRSLFMTFEEFMYNEDMMVVLDLFRPVMVGCGYGYAENMPAPYWMKLMRVFAYERPLHIFTSDFFKSFKNGWQALFELYAKRRGMDVRLNSEVTSLRHTMQKGKAVVALTANGKTENFDRVIVTVPHLAHQFMRFNRQEQKVFSRVKTVDYKVTLLTIDGLPQYTHLFPREYSYAYDKQGNSNDGYPVLISSNQDSNVYQVYQFTEQGKSSEELKGILFNALAKMKVSSSEIIAEESYIYFPHFDAKAFQDGIPQTLDKLQGPSIYFTGSLFNFETVELSVMHAKALVEKHF